MKTRRRTGSGRRKRKGLQRNGEEGERGRRGEGQEEGGEREEEGLEREEEGLEREEEGLEREEEGLEMEEEGLEREEGGVRVRQFYAAAADCIHVLQEAAVKGHFVFLWGIFV